MSKRPGSGDRLAVEDREKASERGGERTPRAWSGMELDQAA